MVLVWYRSINAEHGPIIVHMYNYTYTGKIAVNNKRYLIVTKHAMQVLQLLPCAIHHAISP